MKRISSKFLKALVAPFLINNIKSKYRIDVDSMLLYEVNDDLVYGYVKKEGTKEWVDFIVETKLDNKSYKYLKFSLLTK